MKIEVIPITNLGKTALEGHVNESNDSIIIKQLEKLEIVQTVYLEPFKVSIEWKAKGFLENIRFLKECYPRELQRKINEHKLKINKTMKENGAENFLDYEIKTYVLNYENMTYEVWN